MTLTGEIEILKKHVSLCTTNPRLNALGQNTGLVNEKAETIHLSQKINTNRLLCMSFFSCKSHLRVTERYLRMTISKCIDKYIWTRLKRYRFIRHLALYSQIFCGTD